MTWQKPFPDKLVTGEFGTRSAYRIKNGLGPHRGTDWAPKGNTVIPAIANGTIKLIQWSDVLGWVVVQTAWANGKTYYIGYCHLSCAKHGVNCKGPKKLGDHSPLKSTKVGDKKKAGEPVGRVGTTGKASSGPHLHATLSNSLKGVFYGTVYDLKGFIEEQAKKPSTGNTAPQISKKTAKTTKETVKTVHTCPHCGKELKK